MNKKLYPAAVPREAIVPYKGLLLVHPDTLYEWLRQAKVQGTWWDAATGPEVVS